MRISNKRILEIKQLRKKGHDFKEIAEIAKCNLQTAQRYGSDVKINPYKNSKFCDYEPVAERVKNANFTRAKSAFGIDRKTDLMRTQQ